MSKGEREGNKWMGRGRGKGKKGRRKRKKDD